MAANYSERVYKISVDGAQAVKQLEKIAGSASTIDQRFAKFGSTLRTVFAGAVVITGAQAIAREVLNIANKFDEVGKAAQKVGVAAEALTALNFAASQSGVEFQTLQGGLRRLSIGLTELEDASSKSGAALKALGVTSADTSDTAFIKVAERLSKMPDGFQKTAAAMAVFGKAGAEMIPLLNEGEEGLERFKKRAEELGLVMKSSTIAQLTLFNDSLDELSQAIDGVKNRIAEGLAPALAGIVQTIAQTTKVSNAWVAVGKKIGEVFVQTAIDIEVVITDIQIMALAISTLANLEPWENFKKGQAELLAQSASFESRLRSNVQAADEMTGATDRLGESTDNLFGGGKAGALESWAEGLKKAAEEMALIPEKMNLLATAMATLKERGEESSAMFKTMSEAYKKLNEEMAKGDVGAMIEIEMQKIKNEATLTAEKITYLGNAIASAFEEGDTEGAQILIEMLQKLQGETEKTQTDFEKLGEGIADAIATNANNAVNSFIDNIGDAQLSFAEFATSVVKDIAKMIVQLLIMKPLMQSIRGLFPGGGGVADYAFADGASFSGGTSLAQGVYTQPTLFKFAKGGTFGHTGVMGEAGPEAIIPLKRSSSGELGVVGSPVNVNVYNNAGVEVETQSSQSADGTKQIDIYIERKIRDGITNGSFDRQFRGAYGLSRIGA